MDNVTKNTSSNSLRFGIVGLPNVGKSTLFSALCQRKVLCENFPFCTIEPNVGVVPLADQRLYHLSELASSAATIPTTVNVVDIAGLVKDASKGEGLGNKFLAHIREVDAIAHVVRCFDDHRVVHVAGGVDPVFDKDIINHELRSADIALLEKRALKMSKKLKTGDKEVMQEHALLERIKTALEAGKDARDLDFTDAEHRMATRSQLLTLKPIIYVANVDEETLQGGENPHLTALKRSLKGQHKTVVPICIGLEAQIAALPPEERADFLSIYGIKDSSLGPLIAAVYTLLGLITYFTAGPKETRAWTIAKNTCAPQAAGVIHSDLERDFIRAEVIKFQDYLTYKTENAIKKAGKLNIEGKNYVVQDGDVIYFRCRS